MRIGLVLHGDHAEGVLEDHGRIRRGRRLDRPAGAFETRVEELLRALTRGAARDPAGRARLPDSAIDSITFDVSGVLAREPRHEFTAIRIAPGANVAPEFMIEAEAGYSLEAVHVPGGHTVLGEPLVPFDRDRLLRALAHAPPGVRYVVTAVGSLVNPAHELEAGSLLLSHVDPASVEFSHRFTNGAFAVRERSALLNSSLQIEAAALETQLALASEAVAPQARLFVATNDGGSVPLARLADTPLHSLYAGRPTTLVGAASLTGATDGPLVVSARDGTFSGELFEGAPAVTRASRDPSGRKVASELANIHRLSPSRLSGLDRSFEYVLDAGVAPEPLGVLASAQSEHSLRALGAARLPLSEWVNQIVNVRTPEEMADALVSAEGRVRARLVSFGSIPSKVRVLESRATATAYQDPNVVSVRVRGIAEQASRADLLNGGARDTTHR